MLNAISSPEGKLSGDLAPLYQCVFNKSGVEARFIEVPLKRGFNYLHRGEIDVLLPLARSEKRDSVGLFGGELFPGEYVYVSLKPIPPVPAMQGLRYAVPRGFIGAEFFPEGNSKVAEVGEWPQLAAMLRYDRIDVAVLPQLIVESVFGPDVVDVFQRPAGVLPISFYLSSHTEDKGIASKLIASVNECSVVHPYGWEFGE
jgi:polar amino acid transport system substrate-binding protein